MAYVSQVEWVEDDGFRNSDGAGPLQEDRGVAEGLDGFWGRKKKK